MRLLVKNFTSLEKTPAHYFSSPENYLEGKAMRVEVVAFTESKWKFWLF